MEQQLKRLNRRFEIIPAVDGKCLNSEDLQCYSAQQAMKIIRREMSPGEIGCALSHAKMWERIVAENIEEVLIFEDDVTIKNELIDVLEWRHTFPDDWEFINFRTDVNQIPFGLPIYMEYRFCRFQSYANRTCAYFINIKGAKKLCEHVYPIRLAADGLTGRTYISDLISYGMYPDLVELANFPSVRSNEVSGTFIDGIGREATMPIEQSTSVIGAPPLVSAIVSAYNTERFIRGCLEDLEAQTIAERLEIIVVDSGSQQNEWTIVREFQQRYDNIVYIRTARRESIYAAWNRGIQAARGAYITNANTDDRHKRDAFEHMASTLETRPDIALVYANAYMTRTENEIFAAHTLVGELNWPDFDRLELLYRCYIGPQPMWRKRMHTTYGYFDESFEVAGDWEFWLRMAENETFLHIREFLGLYLSSPAGAENRNPELLGQENLRVYQRYVQRADQLTNAGAAVAGPVNTPAAQPTNTEVVPSAAAAKSLNIKAYPLYDHAATLQPASDERAWTLPQEAIDANLALGSANRQGWLLRCPHAFEATWNGGPHPEDIAIRLETAEDDAPAFVQSHLGGGLLTCYTGYQFQTEAPYSLWVRGPINLPKDGLYPLEQLVDTSLLPANITINWTFTRPNQTIRFEQGEPFCAILPYAISAQENVTLDLVPLDADADLAAYERAVQQLVADPAIKSVFQRLGSSAGAEPSDEAAPSSKQREFTPSRWADQLSDPPPVSCICPTYGRVELLEEAIQSFLQQDYPGQKELIILNDYAEQTLDFDHPEVRIINVPKRFNSVGEKYKAAAGLCTHDLIVVWHDDDIYLPHRLSFSVAHFNPKRGFFKANSAWFWNDGRLSGPDRNTFHGGSCFSRELFTEAQGYPHVGNTYDIGFEVLCEDLRVGATKGQQITPEDVYYIYRWAGTGSYHLSLTGQNGHGRDAVAAHVREQAERGQIERGQIRLAPRWKTDYAALVRNYLANAPAKRVEAALPFPPPFFVISGPQAMDEATAQQLFRDTYPARISVVLPALNESVLLKRTVEQFEATLPANCEIIVVDNGSTDGSADFLADCTCNTVSLIQSAKPLGVAGARNRGLAAARGEVVVFADAHIDLPEHWWQPVVATLNRPNVGVVGPGIGSMGQPERNVAYAQRIAEPNLRLEWLGWQQRDPYPVPTLGGGFMAMRRETLECAGGFDPGMPQWGSEDLELCMRYWLLGYEVWVVPDVTILHYFRVENPLKVKPGIVTHNVLRVALLHFNQERIARVVSALKTQGDFGHALAHAVESDVWQRRAEFAARRARDDDWFFERFKESCPV
jgi:glycosyltransferase involved in cell wall biosynthesis/GR25 family glycosyltransferase involved in LPS biosynthesis